MFSVGQVTPLKVVQKGQKFRQLVTKSFTPCEFQYIHHHPSYTQHLRPSLFYSPVHSQKNGGFFSCLAMISFYSSFWRSNPHLNRNGCGGVEPWTLLAKNNSTVWMSQHCNWQLVLPHEVKPLLYSVQKNCGHMIKLLYLSHNHTGCASKLKLIL